MNRRFSLELNRLFFIQERLERCEHIALLRQRCLEAIESMLDSTDRITVARIARFVGFDRHVIREVLDTYPALMRIMHRHGRLIGKGRGSIKYHFAAPSIAPSQTREHEHESA